MKRRALLLLASLVGASCSAIIGIEDAEVDPTLRLEGQGGAGAVAGSAAETGGSAGTQAGGSAGIAGSAGSAGIAGSAGSAGTGGGGGGQGGTPSTGGAPTGEDAGTADADAAPPETLCEQFCRVVQTNCTGAHQVYSSQTVCLNACSTFEEGTRGDESGNTAHCRLTNAELAASTGEANVHCPAASPGGADLCGSNCDGFCVMLERFCPTFGTQADCLATCPSIPDLGGYNISIQAGDSMQCRIYHVSAATLSPSTHCIHAAGQDICIP